MAPWNHRATHLAGQLIVLLIAGGARRVGLRGGGGVIVQCSRCTTYEIEAPLLNEALRIHLLVAQGTSVATTRPVRHGGVCEDNMTVTLLAPRTARRAAGRRTDSYLQALGMHVVRQILEACAFQARASELMDVMASELLPSDHVPEGNFFAETGMVPSGRRAGPACL
jgi:hypothetical protein